MLLLLTLLTIVASLFYYFAIKPMSYWKDMGVKQTKPLWLFGDTFKTVIGIQKFYQWISEVYHKFPNERYFGIYQMTKPTLVIKDPELIKQLCIKDFEHFVDHIDFIAEDIDPLWSKNLFALKGQKWRDMRPILSPFFTSSKMKNMFVLMSNSSENFVKFFLNKDQEIVEVECKDIFTRFCNDIIATTAFGIETDSLKEPNNEFYRMGIETTDLTSFWKSAKIMVMVLSPKLSDFLKVKLFGTHISSFFFRVIDETIRVRDEKSIVRPDLIHLLLEARKGIPPQQENNVMDTGFSVVEDFHKVKSSQRYITNEEIAAQAVSFFFGGFDSNSSLMSFIVYELAMNPTIQDKLRHEVVETVKACNGEVTYEGLMKMKYLDMVVSETLRKWPNTLYIDRQCTQPYTIQPVRPGEKPVNVRKGDIVWFPSYALHHDPELFPDPEKFDPERFSEENKGTINTNAYFPFGMGPRNCIGSRYVLMENKIIIFHLLYNFEIVVIEKSPIPLVLTNSPFQFISKTGFWFGLKRLRK